MGEPLYYLGAAPAARVHVPTLTREQGVRQFLENPPSAREAGWNLLTYERAELLPGPRLHIQNGERKFIDLDDDASFTAIGTFDGFLGHGRWNFSQHPLINGLAIVEFTYEFVRFYERLLHEYVEPLPEAVRFVVGVRNAHYQRDGVEQRLRLAAGPIGDFYDLERFSHESPASSFSDSIDATVSTEEPHLDAGLISFQLLRRLFNSFGHTDDAVPYVNETHEAIDFAQIENMRR
jgi:hypothetical protein